MNWKFNFKTRNYSLNRKVFSGGRKPACYPFLVLTALVAANGRYISMKKLIDFITENDPSGGPLYTNMCVIRAIKRLRDRHPEIFIETTQRLGYRLTPTALSVPSEVSDFPTEAVEHNQPGKNGVRQLQSRQAPEPMLK